MVIAVHATDAAAAGLEDIPDKYAKEIHYLLDQDVINGYPNGTFGPKLNVTREEAVKMVASAIGLDGTPRTTSFKDVTAMSWSSGFIQSAHEAGLLSSITGENFRPKEKMTRGEMAFLLQQAFKLEAKSQDITISDISQTGALYEAINAIVAAGLSNGYPDGSFKPNNQVTREEFALFVARGLNEDFRVTPEPAPEEEQPEPTPPVEVEPPTEEEEPVVEEQPTPEAPDESLAPEEETTPDEVPTPEGNQSSGDTPVQDGDEEQPSNEAPTQTDNQTPTPDRELADNEAIVTATELHVRSDPTADTTSNIIGSLIEGDVVLIEFIEGDWAYIHGDMVSGYVHRSYISTNGEEPPLQPVSPGGKIIVLDPGHGGKDPGAVANGLREKDINLSVALKVEKILTDKGFTVLMTRKDDTFLELKDRVNFAVKNNADVFVSIHANNFSDGSANGTETYYSKAGPTERANQSKQMAGFIQERLHKALGTKNRGVKDAKFVVIHTNPIPSTLIELGFLSNKGDATKLASNDYQNKAAQAIADGIVEYYNWRK